jgi:hypothetical protein
VRAGQLARHVGQCAQLSDRVRPQGPRACRVRAHRRRAQMVQHERQSRHRTRRRYRTRELMRRHHHVEAQPRTRQPGQPAQHRRPGQPVRIGLGQHRMPDAAQERPAPLRPQARHRLGDIRRGQVRPPHHAGQQACGGRASARRTSVAATVRITARRQRQQVGRLPGLGHGLDDHRAGNPRRRRQRRQLREPERPPQPGQLLIAGPGLAAHQPPVLPGGDIPQVVVRIDHDWHDTGAGKTGQRPGVLPLLT